MRILLAGSGSIGRRHARTLQRLVPRSTFVLLRREIREDEFSRELGAVVVCTNDSALHTKPDLAVIATPSAMHLDLLIPLLTASVPCYVEKPVVATLTQADTLTDWMERADTLPATQCGCNLRFLPSLITLRNHLHCGEIGRPVRASLQAGQWLPDWRPGTDYRTSYSSRADLGGGVVRDLIHELDAARWLFGDFDRVAAFGGRFSSLEISTEDTAIALLSRDRGPVVSVGIDYVARRPMRRYELIGEEGTLSWDFANRDLHIQKAQEIHPLADESDFDMDSTYEAAMREFLLAISSGGTTSQPLSEGLQSARLALAVHALISA